MTTATKRPRQGLEYWLDRRGFTAESEDPNQDGTVQIRVLRPKRGQPRRFPQSFYIVPADDMGDDYWQGRIRDLLEIPEDQKLRIIAVAGWFPQPGSDYRVRIRRGRGGLVYAFPAERRNLQDDSWRPGPTYLQGGKWRFRKGKEIPGRPRTYFATHPDTGQYILTWGEVPIPEGAQEALVDMAGLMIRPVRTAAYWIAGKPREIDGLTEGQMVVHDEDLARRIFLATTSHAPDILIFGKEWSPPEIFGTPQPVKQSDSHLLGQQFEQVLSAADTWRRRELMPAIHPDSWPEETLNQLTPGQKQRLIEAAGDIYAQLELAWDWYVQVLKQMESNIRFVVTTGIPLSKRDFTLPRPEGRPQRKQPLMSLVREEIRQMAIDYVTGKRRQASPLPTEPSAQPRSVKSKTVTSAPRPAKVPPTGTKKRGKLAPQRRQGRVVASTGKPTGGSNVREATRQALAANGELPAEPPKPKKVYYFGRCPRCGRRIRTNKEELSGKKIKGALCRKCAKKK